MTYFKHNNGAIVEIDEKGKKTIHKYELKFRSFLELKQFENECRRKGVSLEPKANKDLIIFYREYKQK